MVPLPLRWVVVVPQHSTSHRILKFSIASQDEHQIIGYTLHSYTYGMGVGDGCSRLCCVPFIHVSICAMQSVCVVWMGVYQRRTKVAHYVEHSLEVIEDIVTGNWWLIRTSW